MVVSIAQYYSYLLCRCLWCRQRLCSQTALLACYTLGGASESLVAVCIGVRYTVPAVVTAFGPSTFGVRDWRHWMTAALLPVPVSVTWLQVAHLQFTATARIFRSCLPVSHLLDAIAPFSYSALLQRKR